MGISELVIRKEKLHWPSVWMVYKKSRKKVNFNSEASAVTIQLADDQSVVEEVTGTW